MRHYLQFILFMLCIGINTTILPTVQAKQQVTKLPEWYVNTPTDTKDTLYGTGRSLDQNTAIRQALGSISDKIMVTISTLSTTEAQEVNQNITTSYSSKVKAQGEAISFSNYKVLQSEMINGEFIVLVAVNHSEVIKQQLSAIEDIRQQVNQYAVPADLLTRINNLYAIADLQSQYNAKHKILTSLGTTLTEPINFQLYADELQSIQRRLNFVLQSKAEDTLAVDALTTGITNAGFKISKTFNRNEKYSILVKISQQITHQKIDATYFSKGTVILEMYNNADDLLRRKEIGITGKSMISSAEADNQAMQALRILDFKTLLQ